MNTKLLTIIALTGALATAATEPVQAGTADETRNLFESAGAKQTSKDFKPAPSSSRKSGTFTLKRLRTWPSWPTL